MGQFSVQIAVSHPTEASREAQVELLVDTGATLTWISREVLDRLGVPRVGRRSFVLADGRNVERETAVATVRFDGIRGGVTVVIAEPGDGQLLGATALETLGLAVDPVARRLVRQALLAM
jgi:clan AA aspartic protease